MKGHDSSPLAHDRDHSYPYRDHIFMGQTVIISNQVPIFLPLWYGGCIASVQHTILTSYTNHDPAPFINSWILISHHNVHSLQGRIILGHDRSYKRQKYK